MKIALSRARIGAALLVLAACSDHAELTSPGLHAPGQPAALALTVEGIFTVGGTEVQGINTAGQMTGTSYESDRAYHAVRWAANGTRQVLAPLSGDTNQVGLTRPGYSFGYDISSAGCVVGSSTNTRWVQRATIWCGGDQPWDLGGIVKTYHSVARGINSSGMIVGWEHLGYEARAFRIQYGGTQQYLGVCTGFQASEAYDINDGGTIVGVCSRSTYPGSRGFVWTPTGGLQLLPLRPGMSVGTSAAFGINTAGVIAGEMSFDTVIAGGTYSYTRAVTWTPDGVGGYSVTDLGWLPGGRSSSARAINDRGRVAGVGNTGTGTPTVAWAWDAREGMQALANTASEAYAINDNGLVVGKLGGGVRWQVSWPLIAPAALAATPVSASRIDLAWADSSAEETSYQLERRLRNPDGSWGAYGTLRTLPHNTTAAADSGLAAGRTYQYRVRACRTQCSEYATSNEATTLSPPASPATLRAAVLPGLAVEVTWVDASSNETGFELTRRVLNTNGSWSGYSPVATAPAGATRHVDPGLLTGRTYQYRLRACNAVGCSGYIFTTSVVVGPVPAAPSAPVGTVAAPTLIQVRWADRSSDETRFNLARRRRNPDGTWAGWIGLTPAAANATSAADSAVRSIYVYQYRVSACNLYGCSAWVEGAPVVLPGAPAQVTATPMTATSITVGWTDRTADETGYQLGRRVRNDNGTWSAYTSLRTQGANTESFGDTGVSAGRTYQYRVRACNATGCSSWVVSAYATTPAS